MKERLATWWALVTFFMVSFAVLKLGVLNMSQKNLMKRLVALAKCAESSCPEKLINCSDATAFSCTCPSQSLQLLPVAPRTLMQWLGINSWTHGALLICRAKHVDETCWKDLEGEMVCGFSLCEIMQLGKPPSLNKFGIAAACRTSELI